MKLVLLSGGSGKRLWPLSNDQRSKQFLKVLRNEEGGLESMVQRVFRQIRRAGLEQSTYIATGRSQLEILQSQLGGEVPVIVEPERRDTFPAIALAAVYLYAVESLSLNETIVVLPVDPYVDDSFFRTLPQLERVLEESAADLALIGIKPTSPSEKFGYIVPRGRSSADAGADWMRVDSFFEKPKEDLARELIGRGALWNCGVFAFKLNYLITLLIEMGLPLNYEEMRRQYGKLNAISFDYQVVERALRIAALPYDGMWKDLGTWNTLTEQMQEKPIGPGILTKGSTGSHLINELTIPIMVLDAPNIVVAASPDGILVADKAAAFKIKDVVKPLENRPMYEERRWGRYRVLDYVRYADGTEVLTKRIQIVAGKNLSYQYHEKRNEIWTVLAGRGEIVLDGRLKPIGPNDVLTIPAGMRHSVRAGEDLEMIEVQSGTELVEEDIVRLCLKWEEILLLCRT
ncbi:sugar phosphate nucleotidyltransferase [Paenibacillus thermoaerophilus]|uniref:Sugar phosphate nucleotidyltransferase n=1 Tax=Paenibacillus thermoaerophilus TaxID=1215385 RepID=A0ABW2V846_9BACL|nr:sugar phosphate nucleotidyltransferase [Paenibacillus thermoaerophilus]TMV16159.1 cupin domain-containing protein [Paenibacillus thermoaerophilus]